MVVSVTDIVGWLKTVGEALKKADKIPEYDQILILQWKILDLHALILSLQEENNELKYKIKEIWDQSIQNNKLKYVNDCYVDDDGMHYCSHCRDVDKKLIKLHRCGNRNYGQCPACKNQVNDTGKDDFVWGVSVDYTSHLY